MGDAGAARTRLATRESFFGGPVSTREQSKAPGWQAFVKPAPAEKDRKAGRGGGGLKAGRGGGGPAARAPPPDPEKERVRKLQQRRDFSGLNDDSAAPPPAKPSTGGSRQQTAAGPPLSQQQQQRAGPGGGGGGTPASQRSRGLPGDVLLPQARQPAAQGKARGRRAAGGGGGKVAVAGRSMAMEVTALGKGRKQLANEALQKRVGDMIQARGGGRPAAAASLGSPGGSNSGGGGGAAAAAARAAREAATAKGVMQTKQYRTATGMQTLQLVSRPQGQGAQRGGGGAGFAAMRAGGTTPQRPAASPGSVTKGARPRTGAGVPRAMQRPGAAAAAGGRAQIRGAFYGGQQPPAALEARMQYNKRRLSLDSGGDLDSFIASEEEGEEEAGEEAEDWRAALREATGGYDPAAFRDVDKLGTRDMEAAYGQIQAEERRAARIGRAEDEREAELEALREAAKRERKRRKKGAAAFLDDD